MIGESKFRNQESVKLVYNDQRQPLGSGISESIGIIKETHFAGSCPLLV